MTAESRGRAWMELLRLPNVFTALADVGMGLLVTGADVDGWTPAILLLVASAALYLAGIVLNDVYDVEVDRVERPHRPLPSGRINVGMAARAGAGFLLFGCGLGIAASIVAATVRPGLIAALLALVVWSYDAGLKRTVAAPVGMGLCRTLNVLLGMSMSALPLTASHWALALGIGVYIAGVTIFAKGEAEQSLRLRLSCGVIVVVTGLVTLATYHRWNPTPAIYALELGPRWYAVWILLGVTIVGRCLRAIVDPGPQHVQMAVKNCILSLIVLDAVCCVGVRGPVWGAAILLLLLPAMFLGRWIYST